MKTHVISSHSAQQKLGFFGWGGADDFQPGWVATCQALTPKLTSGEELEQQEQVEHTNKANKKVVETVGELVGWLVLQRVFGDVFFVYLLGSLTTQKQNVEGNKRRWHGRICRPMLNRQNQSSSIGL